MQHKHTKNSILSILLAAVLILTLLPITAQAAPAVGNASATAGYSYINIVLSSGTFSANTADVETPGNWTLTTSGGQTITSISIQAAHQLRINLSGNIAQDDILTIQGNAFVFAAGTTPPAAPLNVNITVPVPAVGTAAATIGQNKITVTLTEDGFGITENVQNPANWILGGASSVLNSIASVSKLSGTQVVITLGSSVSDSDDFTITALQSVFSNIRIAPFPSPLQVTISANDTTPPAFASGYPKAGPMQTTGTKMVQLLARPANETVAVYYVVVSRWAAAPSAAQVVAGKDSTGASALASSNAPSTIGEAMFTFSLPAYNTEYDAFVVIEDAAGNRTLSARVTLQTPQEGVCKIGGTPYPTLDAAVTAASTGQTITVLNTFTHTSPVTIENKNLTFDLTEGNITIQTSGGTALTVKNCIVTLTGGGFIDARGDACGVRAENATITVRYASATGTGAYAINGGVITVQGDATGGARGAYASGIGSSVTVNDDAISTGANGTAAEADSKGQLQVKNALATGANSYGAKAIGSGTAINITDNAQDTQGGVLAQNSAEITVGGDVIASGGGSGGAWADTGGKITIDGSITAESYVKTGTVTKTAADKTLPATKPGYHTYTDGTSTVWVKDNAAPAYTIAPITNQTMAALTVGYASGTQQTKSLTITKTGTGNLSGLAVALGGANASDFIITPPAITTLNAGAPSTAFTVKAKGGLAAGTYTATVTISAANMTDVTFTVTQVVNPAAGGGAAAPAYNAAVDGGASSSLPISVNTGSGSASVDLGSIAQDISGGGETVVAIPAIPGVSAYTLNMPSSALDNPEAPGNLIVATGLCRVSFPGNMLTGTGLSGEIGVSIGAGDKSSLPGEAQAAIGGRPLIQLTLTVGGVQSAWSNPGAPVTVTIPYTPTEEELQNPESIVIWYIDGAGSAFSVPNGRYNPATGTVTFSTTHFSHYAVGYNKVGFNDVAAGAWYSKPVRFIAARGITGGTGDGNFSPDARLTRGQFIVMLMKACDMAPDLNPKDNFSDAGSTYYTGYLAAAKRLGISGGAGGNLFAPEQEITHQEMFTLLYNALKVIGKLPQGDSGRTLSDFTDASDTAAWAKEAITLLVKTGAVGGSGGRLNPAGTATRAEMAQTLYNLLSK